jgi:hypothetical protein
MERLRLENNKLSGTLPFAYVAWFGSTSVPLAEKALPFALAAKIPLELCQCGKLTWVDVSHNQLAGTFRQNNCLECQYASLPLGHYYAKGGDGGRGGGGCGGGSAKGGGGVESGVASHGASKDLHRRPPGAQVERSSRRSCRRMCPHATFSCNTATKDGLGRHGGRVGVGSTLDERGNRTKEEEPGPAAGRQGGRGTAQWTNADNTRAAEGGGVQAPRSGER